MTPERIQPTTAAFDPARIALVAFDFDGVVLESADIKTDAFVELFAEYPQHLDAIRDHHLAHQGVSRYEKFRWIHEHLLGTVLSDAESQVLGERFSAIALSKILAAPMVPGCQAVLRLLKRRGTPAVVCSGTPEQELRTIVAERDLSQWFESVRGSPDSKTTILTEMADRHAVPLDAVLMIGDADTDFRAASDAGTQFYGRNTGDPLNSSWHGTGCPSGDTLDPLHRALQHAWVPEP